MTFDVGLMLRYVPDLANATLVTMAMWLGGSAMAILAGFVVALLQRYGGKALAWPLRTYVEVMRGTPFLIQLFLLYYGGPFIGLDLGYITAGLVGLTAYGAAYFAEIFRAGFQAVPRGHIEAAECAGLSHAQIVRRIIVPEMTMLVLPSTVNMVIVLLKETAVLSIITVPELTLVITGIGSQYYAFVESLFLLALFYWGLVELASLLGRKAERRLAKFSFSG